MANTNNLSIYQKDVYDKISRNFSEKKFNEYLLHGVTGSGKTEIYIRLVENILMQNKEAIVLVPEIILTPQIEKNSEVSSEIISRYYIRVCQHARNTTSGKNS